MATTYLCIGALTTPLVRFSLDNLTKLSKQIIRLWPLMVWPYREAVLCIAISLKSKTPETINLPADGIDFVFFFNKISWSADIMSYKSWWTWSESESLKPSVLPPLPFPVCYSECPQLFHACYTGHLTSGASSIILNHVMCLNNIFRNGSSWSSSRSWIIFEVLSSLLELSFPCLHSGKVKEGAWPLSWHNGNINVNIRVHLLSWIHLCPFPSTVKT